MGVVCHTLSDDVNLLFVQILEPPAWFIYRNPQRATMSLKMLCGKLSNGNNFSISNDVP